MNPGMSEPTHILSGWKDIANYLGKGVRTVQRYEEELRLPIRRPAGKTRGSVVATTAELDAWVAASPVREEYQASTRMDACATSRTAIQQGIREMRILQEKMRALRAEMTRSVFLLKESIHSLQGGVTKREPDSVPADRTHDSASNHEASPDPVGDFTLPKAS